MQQITFSFKSQNSKVKTMITSTKTFLWRDSLDEVCKYTPTLMDAKEWNTVYEKTMWMSRLGIDACNCGYNGARDKIEEEFVLLLTRAGIKILDL